MLLGYALSPFGHHPDAWRQARDGRLLGFDALLDQVSAAETAGFDFVLLADRVGLRPVDDLSSVAVPFEPTLLASALATRVKRIGILAAAVTAQHEPYNLARRFASLDLITKGRAGWMVVADGADAAREREYVDVVKTLWDSFEDDAFVYDKVAGRFFDPSKMHIAHHSRTHFSVRGPLNVNRSPQGRPVMAHLLDGGNDTLAFETGELLLLQARAAEDLVRTAGRTIKAIESAGRRREDIRILASIGPVIASAAQDMNERLELSGEDRTAQPLLATRLLGTPRMIVDQLQELKAVADLDGFTILPPTLEMGQRFVADVVPEFRQRGLINDGSDATLRDRLRLARPVRPAVSLREVSR